MSDKNPAPPGTPLGNLLSRLGNQLNKNLRNDLQSAMQESQQAIEKIGVRLEVAQEQIQQELASLNETVQRNQSTNGELLSQMALLRSGLARLTQATQATQAQLNGIEGTLSEIQNPPKLTGITDAGTLFILFSEIKHQISRWSQCDLLFTCATTYAGACALLPGKNIFPIHEPLEILTAVANRKVDTIGLISPWLFRQCQDNPATLMALQQSCREHLLFVDGYNSPRENTATRKKLHRTGFYEIAMAVGTDQHDFSSVGYAPDGRFDFHSSEPGLPDHAENWRTYLASRLPLMGPEKPAWRNISQSPLMSSQTGFGTETGGFALAVTSSETERLPIAQVDIKATMHWRQAARGHASLVACYAGPSDTQMYAALLEVAEPTRAHLSIWLNDGSWTRLASTPIPEQYISHESSGFSLPLWLRVDSDTVYAGSGENSLLEEKNNTLTRTASMGIRIADDAITVADIVHTILENR